MKSWYSIKNKAANVLDISIHDEIGLWGISAKEFLSDLDNHKDAKVINLSIHSPGGSLIDGLAMYNRLKSHDAKVYGKVEGIAASAASVVLMGADYIEIPENAFIMIHNAWTFAMGDAEELREVADTMEKMQNSIVNIYERRTGIDRNKIKDMMTEETWMNASDALDKGFIDNISDKIDVAAKLTTFSKYFKEMPIKNEIDYSNIETIRDFEKVLRDSGLSKGLATALSSRAKIVFKGEPESNDAELTKLSQRLSDFKI